MTAPKPRYLYIEIERTGREVNPDAWTVSHSVAAGHSILETSDTKVILELVAKMLSEDA